MGASSSGLLDEAKISNIKGLVNSTFQSFSVFYRQQYPAAYIGHLHQEVEPKKEGRGLLLAQGHAPEEVLYQGSVKCSCWDEQGKKCRERYTVLRRDYRVEIHENMETFSRGCAAKLVIQTAGGRVFTTEEESSAHLEQTCAGILNGVKEDSSSVVSSPDVFAVYLHLPYMGHTCFLFQKEEERDFFLSALKTCIRHCNLDPWCDSSYESEAYVRALRLYRQDKGCYESWEMLLGTEEQVLASQVMEEVLSWLQSQIQSRMKGKKTERIRQWLATVQATYTLVLEQLTASLEALREECRQTASASQAVIRSNLDQIISSHCFLEEKIKACVHEEADKVCSESVAPYMSSILEALTENISAGIQGMQHTLHTQMDFTHTNGGMEETKKALSPLRSISLDLYYRQVENLTEKLEDLKERFGLSSTQRLVHSAHLEMEKLMDSAVYTLELFLQSSARLQPSQIPVKMERAKERVLKQLDYDSRVVQRRLYQEALLEITLPALTRKMDSRWMSELQQFEQYIFSDYSGFILVHNVYDDVLRNILSKEIETVVQDAASKKSNSLSLNTSDLAFSRYSLLGETPPRSAPSSPTIATRDSSSLSAAPPGEGKEPSPLGEEGGQTVTAEVFPRSDAHLNADAKSEPSITQSCDQSTVLVSPVIVVTQEFDESAAEKASRLEETQEEVRLGTDTPSTTELTTTEPLEEATTDSDSAVTPQVSTLDATANQDSTDPIPDPPDLSMSTLSSPQATDDPVECDQCDQSAKPENSATPDLSALDGVTEDTTVHHPCPSPSHPPGTHSPTKISLGSLSEAIGVNSTDPSMMQTMPQPPTDRAVYLTGEIKDNWEVERVKEEKQREAANEKEEHEGSKDGKEEIQAGEGKEGDIGEGDISEGQMEGVAQSGGEGCLLSESPAESATALTTEQREREDKVDDEEKESEPETKKGKEDEEEAEEREDHTEKEGEKEKEEEEEVLQSPRPMEAQPQSATENPLDSVAIIRELVVEITEVETVVGPCPNSSHTP
ncbi:protein Niban 1-like isoform X2 [Anoplopoma fimbria]|uniref:protein Niban 1-like isoform X2 n=1 Tax=Anoplopoma fimbria TaxID=229290 RepID=UPI0023EAF471|nr:protein Niban 1-like isoform X2 [Anoplopoma fimbria]